MLKMQVLVMMLAAALAPSTSSVRRGMETHVL
jgi:hypothetical protein